MGSAEALLLKLIVYLPKILFATVGGIIALILSGDINSDGLLKLGWGVIIKLSVSITLGLTIGEPVIYYFGWDAYPVMVIGIVFLLSSALGLLALGIIYRMIQLTFTDKTVAEAIKEVKDAAFAIFGK